MNGQPCLALASDGNPAISAAQAPVQSVNQQTGAVSILGTVRADCVVSSFDSSGNGSCTYGDWTGASGFTLAPDCWATIGSLPSTYVPSAPVVTPGLKSATVNLQAAAKTLNISLGALLVWASPPAGTTVSLACRGS